MAINLPCGHVMSHTKLGPDRFSRFDVYWIQTNKQTNRQTDKPNLYIDTPIYKEDFLILVYTSLHLYKNTPIYKEDFQDPSYLFLCEINSIAYGENKQTAGRLIGKKD